MKLIILSDLYWNKEAKKITTTDIRNYSKKKINSKKFTSIENYCSIIENEKPNIVLLAGDITGDGGEHGFHNAFILLCNFLEKKRIATFFIKGNHDLPRYFKILLQKVKHFKYVKYISEQNIKCKGIRIAGLDFETTEKASRLKNFRSSFLSTKIILAHCSSERRYSLFNFKADYVITGHTKQILGKVDNKVYISLENDKTEDVNYCTLELTSSNEIISFYNLDFNNATKKVTRAFNGLTKFHFFEKGSNYFDIYGSYKLENRLRKKMGFRPYY